MSHENTNKDFRPICSSILLEQSFQQSITERLFQETERNRLREEVIRLSNMIKNNGSIPCVDPNRLLSYELNSRINIS